jgi:hypothetical protein
MSEQQFDQILCECLRREPFQPFVIELVNGKRYEFHAPRLALDYGVAGFLSESEGLVTIPCEEVLHISLLVLEPKA